MVYFLTRESLSSVQEGQRKIILACLSPPGTRRTLDDLVKECLRRGYAATFKQAHTGGDLRIFTAKSILYHIERMGSLMGCED